MCAALFLGRTYVNKMADDALQRRLARLISSVAAPKAINVGSAFAIGTSLGAIRKKNEDRVLVMFAAYADTPEKNFCAAVLSDGMGGLPHGDEAAVFGVSVFVSRILRTPRRPMTDRLRSAALAANDVIYTSYRGRAGATLSAALVDQEGRFLGVNIGDSRIYGLTPSHELVQLSQDDTLAGVLGQGDGVRSDQNQLVQYLGMGEGLEPHIIRASRPLDSILLTTDGVHNASQEMFGRIVRGAAGAPAELVRKLLTLSDLAGGRDNSTVVSLSTKLNLDVGATEHGLTLSFWTVSQDFEVWIPLRVEEGQENPSGPAPPSETANSAAMTIENSPDHASTGKKRRRGNSKRGRNKSSKDDARLPLEEDRPVLDITFPKDE